MATLAEQFKKALSNVEPNPDDVTNAVAAHEEVRKVLNADAKLTGWGIAPFLIGSYARNVSILRVKDVDMLGRLSSPPEDLRPGAALDEFGRVLIGTFEDRVESQHRSFKVDFPDFGLSVDVVPARISGDHWEIPSRPEARAKWIATNPIRLGELTTEMNQNSDFQMGGAGVYVPTVKLVRQIRKAQLGEASPSGLYFEILTYWVFKNSMASQLSRAGYLTKTIREIATLLVEVLEDGLDDPTLSDQKILTKASEVELEAALEAMKVAATIAEQALAEEDECASARLWAKLFGSNDSGEVFELPVNCDEERSKRATSNMSRTPGAANVPAGTGRYA